MDTSKLYEGTKRSEVSSLHEGGFTGTVGSNCFAGFAYSFFHISEFAFLGKKSVFF